MATLLENLVTRQEAIGVMLANGGITASDGSFVSFDQPAYNSDGEQIDWPKFKAGLYQELKDNAAAISSLGGCWEESYSGAI